MNLYDLLLRGEPATSDSLLGRFLEYVESRELVLYPAQEEAVLELYAGKNVILNTPTGSGKSLVATALHFESLAQGRRSVYTCPIKALVNEKWMALCREFGPQNVGLATGDAAVNRDAPILCCTAEILANIALREGERAQVHDVVMDEFHWYADRDRGVAWQVPLLMLPQARFLLMSATLGDTAFFVQELTRRNGRTTAAVASRERPVPLEFAYSQVPLPHALERLVTEGKAPIYVVHFTQADAAESAQDFTSLSLCTRLEKDSIADAIAGFKFSSPYGPSIRTWLRQGIAIHHAGLLPKYRVLVEQLAQKGLLKIICGTDTLGVGINVPIRTVLFTRLCKFDGHKTRILSARDFHQISGRAGRKGFDDRGWVVVQAPEHVIENLKLERKAAAGGRKAVKRKPPEHNFVNWDEKTFQRLVAAPPEQLKSRFRVSHGMLLNVLSRDGDGCRAMRELIRGCHDSDGAKRDHTKRAWQLFRSLLERQIIEFIPSEPGQPPPSRHDDRRKLRVNVDLQDDFSMDQALSLYLLEAIPQLDPESPDYALDLLSLVEAILENPELILRRQLDRIKAAAVADMKAQGMDYQERMDELALLDYPKPNLEFIESTFGAFADKHPWLGHEDIRPKSIAREMFEGFRSFSEYVRDYELQRVEGLLLRHINSVYKVLAQTVPDGLKTDAVREMELYLGAMIRQVDSSLLEEWKKMRDPNFLRAAAAGEELRPPRADEAELDITRDTKAFTAAVRTRIFTFLRAWAIGEYDAALPELGAPDDMDGQPWTPERLDAAMAGYRVEHERLCLDPDARNIRHTYVEPAADRRSWRVQQMLVDPAGHNDWVAEFDVDLARSAQLAEPVLALRRLASLV